MKKLLVIIILSLYLITPSWALGIRDFQIEGLSIGESALNFFSKDKIKNNEKSFYRDDEYIPVMFDIKANDYEWINFHYKKEMCINVFWWPQNCILICAHGITCI